MKNTLQSETSVRAVSRRRGWFWFLFINLLGIMDCLVTTLDISYNFFNWVEGWERWYHFAFESEWLTYFVPANLLPFLIYSLIALFCRRISKTTGSGIIGGTVSLVAAMPLINHILYDTAVRGAGEVMLVYTTVYGLLIFVAPFCLVGFSVGWLVGWVIRKFSHSDQRGETYDSPNADRQA